jgi:tetratricopeptide (TPR) repeat protein
MKRFLPARNVCLVPSSVIILLLVVLTARSQEATIREDQQVFRTYPFGDPDPVARMGNIYPYFRFQGYSLTPVMKSWKIITLENPYLRVLVAPEIGGKILGAFEKSTGKAFIYFNRVVKFREIAMRGPWTSGGIEFNFGDIGHTPTTASPVDYLTRKNPDGSVSCIVGALDLASRTEWRVEIRLPRDKAYFETRAFWYNPTDLTTSRYNWMTAAADAGEDLQVIYPGNAFIGHAGETSLWPHNAAGRDLSFYRNNDFGSYKSYHVLGSHTDFFGALWSRDDFGMLHWSLYTDKPGKKLWIWGLSREGEIWKDLLTDPELGNTQYVELQSGLLFNQAIAQSSTTPFKHMDFPPCSAERFTELWFPFKGIGGVVRANQHGTLNIRMSNGKLFVGFCPLERVRQELSVSAGNSRLYTRPLSLGPLESFVDSLSLPGAGQGIVVHVGDLLTYRSNEDTATTLERPIVAQSPFAWSSAYGLSLDAREHSRQRDYNGAFERFLASVRQEPTLLPSLVGIAESFYRRLEDDYARYYAKQALAIDTYDPDANFIYGLVQRRLTRLFDAEDGFGFAARFPSHRAAAYVQLGEIAFLKGDLSNVEEFARRSLDYDRFNVRAWELLAVLYRRQNDSAKCKEVLRSLLAIDPLNNFARWETYLRKPTGRNLTSFVSLIRNEFPAESFLELAAYYLSIRRFEDAAKVLEQSPRHPMVLYWLAYLRSKGGDGKTARLLLNEAIQEPTTLVFPHRAESADILVWAEAELPHWKTQYYLALLYWSEGRRDASRPLFLSCGSKPDVPAFYLTRGYFFGDDTASGVLADYRTALRIAPDEWRTYATLINYFNQQQQFGEAAALSREGAERFRSNYMLQFTNARTLLFNGDYASSLSILDTLNILPFEGARYGRETYRQACVLLAAEKLSRNDHAAGMALLAKSRLWPERLGAGKPYDVDSRLEDYLEAMESERTNNSDRAKGLLDSIARYSLEHRENGSAQQFIGALALRRLGREREADAFIDAWLKRDPGNPVARWSSFMFRNDPTHAQELEHASRVGALHRSTGDQDFVLVVDVVKKLSLQ